LFTILLFMYITILGGAIGWWRIYLRRNSLHTDEGTEGWTDDSLIFSSIGITDEDILNDVYTSLTRAVNELRVQHSMNKTLFICDKNG
jgi:hypothetical protein